MDFDLRAISLVPSLPATGRVLIDELLGAEVEFRSGLRYSISLPNSPEQYGNLTEAGKTLMALSGWARLYRYPDGDTELIHVLAPAERDDGALEFYRVDMRQPAKPRRGIRPAVEMVGSATMIGDECVNWLIDLSHSWEVNPKERQRHFALSRPCPLKLRNLRIAWVGPEVIDGLAMKERLVAIGRVLGADVVRIVPRGFRDVAKQLSGSAPLHAAIVCRHFCPHITEDVIPAYINRDLVLFCDSSDRKGVEEQVKTWIAVSRDETENQQKVRTQDEDTLLLTTMMRGMLSHSKIGQFNHCQKETVLKGVRARRLNSAAAEGVLDQNSEMFEETRESTALFLWKAHNDGRQYFLNPSRMEQIKLMTLAAAGSGGQ